MPPAPADRRTAVNTPAGTRTRARATPVSVAALGAVVAAVGGLVLVALAARSQPTMNVRPARRPTVTPTFSPPSRPLFTTPSLSRTGEQNTHVPGWLLVLLALAVVALLVPVVLVLIAAARRLLRRFLPRLGGRSDVPVGELSPEDLVVDRELVDGLDTGLNRLAQGPVREAIIACWIELEQAALRAEVVPLPAETAAELAARLLGSRAVDAQSLQRLADLYREARFSAHELDEQRRSEARDCLRRIRADLSAAARDQDRPPQDRPPQDRP